MSELVLPKIDKATINKKEYIFKNLAKIINPENVLSHADDIKPYETDALAAYTQTPLAVVMPENTEEVSNILKFCHKENIKVVPRGAGTGLSGGALPLNDAILLSLGKFNKIIEIDFENKCVVTQPGVTNLGITHAVQHKNFYYAPDPSSQLACSIGGNVAENSGGVHSLKYGTTTNNILGVEMVMMDGTVCRVGGKTLDQEGYDLMGLICGSEGLLGVITEVTVKILKNPQVVKAALIGFPTIEEGGNAASEIISSGIVPAGMEIMDKALIEATDNFSKAGYPRDAELLLIVELDGTESEVDELLKQVRSICEKNNCSSLKLSKNEKERLSFWAGRKAAFPACGAMAPDHGSIEVGHINYSPLLQNSVEGTETMYLMMKNAFEVLGNRRYEWKCNNLNSSSKKAALRLGFKFEGVFRQMFIFKGRSRDSAWFSILDKEWPKNKKRFLNYLKKINFDKNFKQIKKL
ncbi:FAD-binding protein [Candidatus Pelagibacter ubique]|nr:FAD-binding protein [Candidatus Pelagibacter ubique]